MISLATLQTAFAKSGSVLSLDKIRDMFLGTSVETIKDYIKKLGAVDADAFPLAWQTELFARFKAELRPIDHVFELIESFDSIRQQYCIASSGTRERINFALRAMGR